MDHSGTPFENTLMAHLDMEMLEATPDRVVMRLPVTPKVHQPYGMLHGGASVVLAETAASFGTALNIDHETQIAVGREISASHLRSVREGFVTAEALPIHKGRTGIVWDIKIRDDQGRLTCVSRCSVAIVEKRPALPNGP